MATTVHRRVFSVGLLLAIGWLNQMANAQAVQGTLDVADSSKCRVAGWARDPQNANPIQVRIYRDGDAASGTLVATFEANLLRSDLPFPDQSHGFDQTFATNPILADGKSHAIHAYGVAASGATGPLNGNGKMIQCVSLGTPAIVFMSPASATNAVPVHTLVSASFSQDMDPATINGNTFRLTLAAAPVTGTIRYLSASRVAVFSPGAPLQANRNYTATATTGVRDSSGKALAKDVVWSFKIGDGASMPGSDMRLYFGDLHSHSGYSDGKGTPADAFATARANGLDFFALTDHSNQLTAAEWQDMSTQADAVTVRGIFAGLRGFEYTNSNGHINVFGTDTYVSEADPNYNTLTKFYAWIAGQPVSVGQFNHPSKSSSSNWHFNDFAYNAAADVHMYLRETRTSPGELYLLSLTNGWHVGASLSSDTHNPNWGRSRYMGVVAPSLTREAILEALRARRTFATDGRRFAVVMRANGYWMGSIIPHTPTLQFEILAYEPNPSGPLTLTLFEDGTPVAAITAYDGAPAEAPGVFTWSRAVPASPGRFYYVKAAHSGVSSAGYTSPVWIVAAETPAVSRVVNSASFDDRLGLGGLISIFGSNLAGATQRATATPYPATLAGTTVRIRDSAGVEQTAPLALVSPTMISAQIPFELRAGPATLVVQGQTGSSPPFHITLDAYGPGLFTIDSTGGELGTFVRADSNTVSSCRPAAPGEVVSTYATGLGPTDPPVATGRPGSTGKLPVPLTVNVGGQVAAVSYAGAAAGMVGVYQVSFTVPTNAQTGDRPVVLEIAGRSSNTVILPVQLSGPGVSALINAASSAPEAVAAPGSFLSLYGWNLGSKDNLNAFPATSHEGLSVSFDGTLAPLFHVIASRCQINLLSPAELPETGDVKVQVKTSGGTSPAFSLKMAQAAPGIFRVGDPKNPRRNNGAVLFANTAWRVMPDSMAAGLEWPSCQGAAAAELCGQPARPGDAIQVYATGLGRTTPSGDPAGTPLPTGAVAPANGNPLYQTVFTPSVTVGSVPATIFFSGLAPGFAGLYQVNLQIPSGAPTGDDVPVTITMPNGRSDTVTIAIKP